MASPSPSGSWPPGAQPGGPGGSARPAEELEDDLMVQRTILASLLEQETSPETNEQIAEARTEIRLLKRQLAKVRQQVLPRFPGTSTQSNMAAGSYLAPTAGPSSSQVSLSRKRSFETHLGGASSSPGEAKSRRHTPSPEPSALSTPSSQRSVQSIIDLTGDDDEYSEDYRRRQREATDRFERFKRLQEQDAEYARRLQETGQASGSGSASPAPGPAGYSRPPGPPGSNPFNWILPRQQPSPFSQPNGRSSGSSQSQEPYTPNGAGSRPSAPPTSRDFKPRIVMPGHFGDDEDDEDDDVQVLSSVTRAQPVFGVPGFPASPPARPTFGSDSTPSFSYAPGVPAIELARRAALARQQGGASPVPSPSYMGPSNATSFGQFNHPMQSGDLVYARTSTPFTPHQVLHPVGRPGLMINGGYGPLQSFGSSFQPAYGPGVDGSLRNLVARTNRYDYNDMRDHLGQPLSDRWRAAIQDQIEDPRKTDEEIEELLMNIRPDMDIPEEERGQTPPAMKYPLYPHQQLALKWMTNMEEGTNKGGVLADDMGLGKTLSTIALMVTRRSEDPLIKTNLIVGPVALVKQWESEIKKKLKAGYSLSVFSLHGKKSKFTDLRNYDVVLTTYGSVAQEWKRLQKHLETRQQGDGDYDARNDAELQKKCPILHPKSKFYRVVLDEAQFIKNKETQSSKAAYGIKAEYRWCLTGTPMMNGVLELYPLIRFLHIRPYNDFKEFQKTFGSLTTSKSRNTEDHRSRAMHQLRIVLKAVMLRRMKNSEVDGKPILNLPPKTEAVSQVAFSEDEQSYYKALESKSQVTFNKYLRAGTVGKNYTNILVLLLRLRQACCHPHLLDVESAGNNKEATEAMVKLAKELPPAVVQRVMAIESFECPICYDAVADPTLLFPCGHDTCADCFMRLTDRTVQNGIRRGHENGNTARCPQCREPIFTDKTISYTTFKQVHMPETVSDPTTAEGAEQGGSDDMSETDSDTESDSDSDDVDDFGDLKDFIVPDDDVKDEETASEKEGSDASYGKGKKRAGKKKASKNKRKAEEVQPHMLKSLRMEASKNKDAKKRYMRYLRKNWQDSAKVSKCIELLREIQATGEKTIVFSQWTALLDLIEIPLKKELGIEFCRYDGGMSVTQRDRALRDFSEEPRVKVMMVSLKAGNAGLNLTVASQIIICDPFWNPYIEMQAVDRAHRIGQQREVKVHRLLVEGTVEDRIISLQEKKRALIDAALDEGETAKLARLSHNELRYLFGVS